MLAKTAKEIFLRSDLSRSEKIVYFALSTFTDRQNTCFPSHENIAKRAAYSVSTVKRALMRLREMGLVVWKHCFDRDNARLKNKYTVAEPNAIIPQQLAIDNTPVIFKNRFSMPVYEDIKNAARQVYNTVASFFTPRYGGQAMEF